MRVVLSQIFYPCSIGRYVQNALARRSDVELITVGPYTSNWIPWKGGMYVAEKYANRPTAEAGDASQNGRPIQIAEAALRAVGVEAWDVWLQIDANFHFSGRPSQGRHFVIGTDPHCVNYDRQREAADVFFNMQRHYIPAGASDVYLPYAYDPEWHTPCADAADPHYDVALVGLMYDQRKAVFERLRAQGRRVYHDTGPIFDQAREIYHRSRVGFNWSSLEDLNARVFELAAMGVPQVANRVPDTYEFFEAGHHYMDFGTLEGAVNACDWLLRQPEIAQEMAQRALEVVKPHTWDARVEQVLSYV